MKFSLVLWRLCCNGNTEIQGRTALPFVKCQELSRPLQKLLLLRKAILKCKLALRKYHMETKIVFSGAKRKKTIWAGNVRMLYKFGKRQLPSVGLQKCLWLVCCCKWGLCSGFVEKIWAGHTSVGSGYGFASRLQLWGTRCQLHQDYSDVCDMVTRNAHGSTKSVCETLRASSELQDSFFLISSPFLSFLCRY